MIETREDIDAVTSGFGRKRATWLEIYGVPVHCWNGTTQQIQKIREVVNLEVGASTFEVCINEIGFSDYSANRVGITGKETGNDLEIETTGNKSELSCSSEENRSESWAEVDGHHSQSGEELLNADINEGNGEETGKTSPLLSKKTRISPDEPLSEDRKAVENPHLENVENLEDVHSIEENFNNAERKKEKKKKRDRAIPREKKKSQCWDSSELSGRSLSESDLIQHWEILSKRARKALEMGIEIEGDEEEALRELVNLESN
ncbi:hypothetical protein V6N11_068674 [Hibiscus sabdariffa]|uniref:DUF4283 domain-containing protein n=1 Tax=Hibiscus sabdariffa TaxID=183260 RepID=A0ABR2PAF1_9ROSI